MTKYTVASRRRGAKSGEKPVHPIWRGIGCLLILFVPLLSYFLATILVDAAAARNWPVPYQLMGFPVVPPELWKVTSLSPLWGYIQQQANLYAVLLVTTLFIVAIGALVSVAYAFIYRYAGPPALGPYDMPPVKTSVKKYKR
jgi:hypothetical protein